MIACSIIRHAHVVSVQCDSLFIDTRRVLILNDQLYYSAYDITDVRRNFTEGDRGAYSRVLGLLESLSGQLNAGASFAVARRQYCLLRIKGCHFFGSIPNPHQWFCLWTVDPAGGSVPRPFRPIPIFASPELQLKRRPWLNLSLISFREIILIQSCKNYVTSAS